MACVAPAGVVAIFLFRLIAHTGGNEKVTSIRRKARNRAARVPAREDAPIPPRPRTLDTRRVSDMSSISVVRLPAVAVRAAAGASPARRAAALRAPARAPGGSLSLARRSPGAARPRGALVVRGDAIDEAAELATAGAKGVNPDLVGSAVVPKLPRSSCARTVSKDEGFNLATTSFGTIGLSVGLPLLVYGFFSFFNFIGGSVSSLLLIYGFIISLIGFALKYAQLDPLELVTYEDALALRESQSTGILAQVRNDVTRYRYGDEQHLEEALAIIFRYNRPGGLRKNQAPTLVGLAEMVIVDRYALVLNPTRPR